MVKKVSTKYVVTNSFYLQQVLEPLLIPYSQHEKLLLTQFIKSFFRKTSLKLHTTKCIKTYTGVTHIMIKCVVHTLFESSSALKIRFHAIEKAFLYGVSKIIMGVPIIISFFLQKRLKKKKIVSNKFTISKEDMKMLLCFKGSSFFLAKITYNQLKKMRTKANRKLQSRFLFFMKRLIISIFKFNAIGIKGIKITVKGRINGISRSKTWTFSKGRVSLQSTSSQIDFFFLPCHTVYGTFSIKVYISL